MKEEINLLPVQAKKSRQRGLYTSRFNSLYAAILGAIILVGAGYLGSYLVLQRTLRDVEQSLASDQQGTGNVDRQTRKVNADLRVVHASLKQHVPWSPHIAQALQAAPQSVVITSVEVRALEEGGENALIVSGQAQTRSAIVQFENALRELAWSDTIDAPLQNFASGPNVTFQFTITRKL